MALGTRGEIAEEGLVRQIGAKRPKSGPSLMSCSSPSRRPCVLRGRVPRKGPATPLPLAGPRGLARGSASGGPARTSHSGCQPGRQRCQLCQRCQRRQPHPGDARNMHNRRGLLGFPYAGRSEPRPSKGPRQRLVWSPVATTAAGSRPPIPRFPRHPSARSRTRQSVRHWLEMR